MNAAKMVPIVQFDVHPPGCTSIDYEIMGEAARYISIINNTNISVQTNNFTIIENQK